MKGRRLFWIAGAVLVVTSLLAACTLPMSGGVIGGLLALLLAGGVLFGVGFGSSGCSDDRTTNINPCLSVASDAGVDVGVCLEAPPPDGDIGPCLDVVPDGAADVGVCLQPPPPDGDIGPCLDVVPDGGEDISVCLDPPPPDIGVCLEPPPPDVGPDFGPDFGPCLDIDPDAGPCLSIPPFPPDAGQDVASLLPDPTSVPTSEDRLGNREVIIERLADEGALPEAVIERLRQRVARRG